MIGILGGYTTFSSFSAADAELLAQDGQWVQRRGQCRWISVVLCLVGVWLGATLAGMLNQMR